jgi:hypothetical protein
MRWTLFISIQPIQLAVAARVFHPPHFSDVYTAWTSYQIEDDTEGHVCRECTFVISREQEFKSIYRNTSERTTECLINRLPRLSLLRVSRRYHWHPTCLQLNDCWGPKSTLRKDMINEAFHWGWQKVVYPVQFELYESLAEMRVVRSHLTMLITGIFIMTSLKSVLLLYTHASTSCTAV